jgi:hypothetical protein
MSAPLVAARNNAVEFLNDFLGAAPWPLAAFLPAGVEGHPAYCTFSRTPARPAGAAEWISRQQSEGRGVYFAPNPLTRPILTKATKSDVVAAAWLWVDIDPPKQLAAEELDAWRADRLAEFDKSLASGIPEPTWVIDSGRGFWLLWHLRDPLALDGKDGETTRLIEGHGRAMEAAFAPWADHCANVDRVARLPGTLNGKTGRMASVVRHTRASYSLESFPAPMFPAARKVCHNFSALVDLSRLPPALRDRIEAEVVPDRSKHFYGVVTTLDEMGFSIDAIEATISGRPWASAKYGERLRGEIERCAGKSGGHEPSETADAVAGMLAAAKSIEPKVETAAYPRDALGDVLGPAAEAISTKVRVPLALAGQSVLAVASLASQAIADVRLPYGQTRPASLFILTIANSGDRKSSSDHEAMTPVRIREERLRKETEPLLEKFNLAYAAWRGQRAQIDRTPCKSASERQANSSSSDPSLWRP